MIIIIRYVESYNCLKKKSIFYILNNPKAPTTNGMTAIFIFNNIFSSLARCMYLPRISL